MARWPHLCSEDRNRTTERVLDAQVATGLIPSTETFLLIPAVPPLFATKLAKFYVLPTVDVHFTQLNIRSLWAGPSRACIPHCLPSTSDPGRGVEGCQGASHPPDLLQFPMAPLRLVERAGSPAQPLLQAPSACSHTFQQTRRVTYSDMRSRSVFWALLCW